jgi:hypothetical protein
MVRSPPAALISSVATKTTIVRTVLKAITDGVGLPLMPRRAPL